MDGRTGRRGDQGDMTGQGGQGPLPRGVKQPFCFELLPQRFVGLAQGPLAGGLEAVHDQLKFAPVGIKAHPGSKLGLESVAHLAFHSRIAPRNMAQRT
jgi:hypothetical protein